jgi:hypothetical protein
VADHASAADTALIPQQLQALRAALGRLAQGAMSASAFSALAEQQSTLLAALPPRYAEVLSGLLTRLESSALFTDESCSFSRKDLVDSLQMWLDKAGAFLLKTGPGPR